MFAWSMESETKNRQFGHHKCGQRSRNRCKSCHQPEFSCYCCHIKTFDPLIEFVILTHPIEIRRRIATGRMAHLCLKGSHLISGSDFTDDQMVNQIIKDPNRHCLLLFPGTQSFNLSEQNQSTHRPFFDSDKRLTLFVIDGTWATAKKTVWKSENLKSLQRICFTPTRASNFRVRKQPSSDYFSTIEAIHHVIGLLGPTVCFDTTSGEHDKLLYTFDRMIDRQVEFIEEAKTQFEKMYPLRKWTRV